mmetsp:Transcript_33277/g.84719  ORF Transcript_33277/g.84719 Transcript_33277/m.84719 type:complete len:179 (-) Transcript_33277:106-642(-)
MDFWAAGIISALNTLLLIGYAFEPGEDEEVHSHRSDAEMRARIEDEELHGHRSDAETRARIEENFPVSTLIKGWTCAICLEDLCVGESCRKTQCLHCFHAACLDAWWMTPEGAFKCPTCRTVQRTPPEREEQVQQVVLSQLTPGVLVAPGFFDTICSPHSWWFGSFPSHHHYHPHHHW